MSITDQIAFGKNLSLQKQLDQTYFDFKRTFRNSRRRLDNVEEECLTSLYKLMLEAKEKLATNTTNNSKQNHSKRPQSVTALNNDVRPSVPKRPMTAVTSHNFTQSYSFKRDGLNISKYKMGHIKRRHEKAADAKENKDKSPERPHTAVQFKSEKDEKVKSPSAMPVRPQTTDPYGRRDQGSFFRQRIDQLFPETNKSCRHSAVPPATPITDAYSASSRPSASQKNNTNRETSARQDMTFGRKSTSPNVEFEQELDVHNMMPSTDEIDGHLSSDDDDIEPAHVRPTHRLKSAPNPRILITTADLDQRPTSVIVDSSPDSEHGTNTGNNSSNNLHPQTHQLNRRRIEKNLNRLKSPKYVEESILQRSTNRSQAFLNEYAKKSKLFSYIVKTRTSAVAVNEGVKKTYRSPCISYQELVSIKANIKQHESRTRSLLQRSAKISRYVDGLANAANVRQNKSSDT